MKLKYTQIDVQTIVISYYFSKVNLDITKYLLFGVFIVSLTNEFIICSLHFVGYLTKQYMNHIFKISIFTYFNSVFWALSIVKIYLFCLTSITSYTKKKQRINQLTEEMPLFLQVSWKIYKMFHMLFCQIGIGISCVKDYWTDIFPPRGFQLIPTYWQYWNIHHPNHWAVEMIRIMDTSILSICQYEFESPLRTGCFQKSGHIIVSLLIRILINE